MTKDEKRYLSKVQELGCVVCDKLGFMDSPAEIHHVRFLAGTAQRASHFDVIPLCPHHHRTGGYGEAFHAGQKIWQEKFGTEKEFFEYVKSICRRGTSI